MNFEKMDDSLTDDDSLELAREVRSNELSELAGEAKLKEFHSILEKIGQMSETSLPSGVEINPKAAFINRVNFVQIVREISEMAVKAENILSKANEAKYVESINPLISNSSFNFVCYADGQGPNSLSHFDYSAMPDSDLTPEKREAWVTFLQQFFDAAKKMKDDFTAYDQDGRISSAIKASAK